LFSSNISSTCAYYMVNFGPRLAEMVSLVWGTPANFNRFRALASLLQQRRSTEAKQTLQDVWPSPGRLHYKLIPFWRLCPVTEFCQVLIHFASSSLHSPIGSVTARHSSNGRESNFAALSTGRHLDSAGRPSRWALAHILVSSFFPRLISAVTSGMSILLHMVWP